MSARVELYRETDRIVTGRSFIGDVTQEFAGKWRWRFVSSNGRPLADSGQGYQRRIDAVNGCAVVLGARLVTGDPDHAWLYRLRETVVDEAIPVVDLTREAK